MTANNGWPGKPGVPLNPEKDGWHWLETPDGERVPYEWRSVGECERGRWPSYWVSQGEDCWEAEECKYLGPVLTPDEAAALQKKGCVRDQKTTQYCADVVDRDKRIAELEAALKPLSCSCTGFCGVMGWLPADNDACARRQARAALAGGKDEG